jgi:hypothetical protein
MPPVGFGGSSDPESGTGRRRELGLGAYTYYDPDEVSVVVDRFGVVADYLVNPVRPG